MTDARWFAEIEMVEQNNLPFTPFLTQSGMVGFAGELVGQHSRRIYQVVIKAPASRYPAEEPKTYMEPKPESHHWIPQDGTPMDKRHLCYNRDNKWDPARSTFANCILIAVRYLNDFD
jgi:hypothetical protein